MQMSKNSLAIIKSLTSLKYFHKLYAHKAHNLENL